MQCRIRLLQRSFLLGSYVFIREIVKAVVWHRSSLVNLV